MRTRRSGSRSGGRLHLALACPKQEVPAVAQAPSRYASTHAVPHRDSWDREKPAIARRPSGRQAKSRSSELAWLWARQFIGRAPTGDPCLDFFERNRKPGAFEFLIATPVLSNIGSARINDRIQQRHGLSQHRRNVLASLGRHLAKAGVSISVKLDRATNQIHRLNVPFSDRVSRATILFARARARGCGRCGRLSLVP